MREIWKSVIGYEGWYSISNDGRVRRDMPSKNRKSGNILKPFLIGKGYLGVFLLRNGRQKSKYIHSLVAESFIGQRPLNLEVNHKDGIKINNNPCNLEYVTTAQNTKHAVDNGLMLRGESHPVSKLNNVIVLNIRNLYKTGKHTQKELGDKFGISSSTISQIINRETWKHI